MQSHHLADDAPRLTINADDYGYSSAVSAGIIDGIQAGNINATGIFVHPNTDYEQLNLLKPFQQLDIGVHLNLTFSRPFNENLLACFSEQEMRSKSSVILGLLRGRFSVDDVASEWRMQISKLMESGHKVTFINSHEHLHMFPGLLSRFFRLGEEFDIPWVRYSTPEWRGGGSNGWLLRNIVLGLCSAIRPRPNVPKSAELSGLASSGKLNRDYLTALLPRLQRGKHYELMCHPGRVDGDAKRGGTLAAYHDWAGEHRLLTDPGLAALIKSHGVRLCRFAETTTQF